MFVFVLVSLYLHVFIFVFVSTIIYLCISNSICCYNTAISLEPNYAEAHANLAAALKDAGRLSEAVQLYRKALDLKPGS